MSMLPNNALVVRGGQNLPSNFAQGAGVTATADGKLREVSVNSAAALSLEELTAPNPGTRYPGIPHNQVGVTTVGKYAMPGVTSWHLPRGPTRTMQPWKV